MESSDIIFQFNALKILALMVMASIFGIAFPKHAHYMLLVMSISLVLVGAGLRMAYSKLKNWSACNAIVVAIEEREELVAESQYSKTKYFCPSIKYKYSYNNNSYNSDQVSIEKQNVWVASTNGWGDPVKDSDKWWASIVPGSVIPVFVNPDNPSESVLVREMGKKRTSHSLALIAGGALIGLCWLGLVYISLTS